MSVDQVRELAAAVLIIDQQLDDANRRIASMMLAEPAPHPGPPKTVQPERLRTPIVITDDPGLSKALNRLVEAHWSLNQERHSAGENIARQTFEKAAIAVCDHVSQTKRNLK